MNWAGKGTGRPAWAVTYLELGDVRWLKDVMVYPQTPNSLIPGIASSETYLGAVAELYACAAWEYRKRLDHFLSQSLSTVVSFLRFPWINIGKQLIPNYSALGLRFHRVVFSNIPITVWQVSVVLFSRFPHWAFCFQTVWSCICYDVLIKRKVST